MTVKCVKCGGSAEWSGAVMDSIPQVTSINCSICGELKLFSGGEGGPWVLSYEEARELWNGTTAPAAQSAEDRQAAERGAVSSQDRKHDPGEREKHRE